MSSCPIAPYVNYEDEVIYFSTRLVPSFMTKIRRHLDEHDGLRQLCQRAVRASRAPASDFPIAPS